MTSKKQTAEIVLWKNGKDASTFPDFWQVIPCMDVQSLVLPLARAEGKEEAIRNLLDSLDSYIKEKGYGFPLRDAMIEGSVIIDKARFLKEKEEKK